MSEANDGGFTAIIVANPQGIGTLLHHHAAHTFMQATGFAQQPWLGILLTRPRPYKSNAPFRTTSFARKGSGEDTRPMMPLATVTPK